MGYSVKPLTGKVGIVTGGAQGVGKCIAEFLCRDGAHVMIGDKQGNKANAVAESLTRLGYGAEAFMLDISVPEAAVTMVERTIERFGRVDILVNNAAIDAPSGFAPELTAQEWQDVINVNLSGSWWCTKAVLPYMMGQGSGRIIFISSMSWRVGSRDISVAYNAAKAGLIGLTIGLSVHMERYGILVNAITPGPTGTGSGQVSESDAVRSEREFPLGIGGPEPVAHACLYLARESGDWISGAVLNVSGGRIRG